VPQRLSPALQRKRLATLPVKTAGSINSNNLVDFAEIRFIE